MPAPPAEERVLIVAPVGQDAVTMAAMLEAEGMAAWSCSDLFACLDQISKGAGTLLLTEEALELPGFSELFEALKAQPPWSELPLIILTRGGESRMAALLDLAAAAAGSVVLLERPMAPVTLIRSIQVALRSRRRQYQVRDLLTEQQRQKEALQQSEETARQQWAELEGIYHAAPIGLCVFDRSLRYLRINQRLAEINGIPIEAHIGKTAHEVVPTLAKQAEEIIGKVIESRQPVRFELKGQTAAQPGVERVWDEQWFPLGSGGEIEAVGVVVQDITERKAFQAELERLVTERTAKLQELVTELEHFSYTITHDMRAPLRAMQGFAEMFADASVQCQQQDAKRFLQRIRTSANRMDALIVDALSYSEAIRKHLPLSPVDPGVLLRGMLDTYPELQPPHARIQVQSEIPRIFANEAGLTQVFSNLLNNAIKFANPGRPAEIRVWAEIVRRAPESPTDPLASPNPIRSVGFTPIPSQPLSGSGGSAHWVRIWIEDDGVGISSEMLPRVFNMFARGNTEQSGTGIGLALVRKVVDRMGGRVGVESEEGHGSRFWVELTPAN